MAKTTYKFIDSNGEEVEYYDLEPWTKHAVKVVSVEFEPNNDPEDPDVDGMVVTYELLGA